MSDELGGRLTTHVLDVRLGRPAAGLAFALYRRDGATPVKLTEGLTNHDGRADEPLLAGAALKPGLYELVFAVGDYQARLLGEAGAGFYDSIPVRFRVTDAAAHYHVPLLLSPYGYSTYRGS